MMEGPEAIGAKNTFLFRFDSGEVTSTAGHIVETEDVTHPPIHDRAHHDVNHFSARLPSVAQADPDRRLADERHQTAAVRADAHFQKGIVGGKTEFPSGNDTHENVLFLAAHHEVAAVEHLVGNVTNKEVVFVECHPQPLNISGAVSEGNAHPFFEGAGLAAAVHNISLRHLRTVGWGEFLNQRTVYIIHPNTRYVKP